MTRKNLQFSKKPNPAKSRTAHFFQPKPFQLPKHGKKNKDVVAASPRHLRAEPARPTTQAAKDTLSFYDSTLPFVVKHAALIGQLNNVAMYLLTYAMIITMVQQASASDTCVPLTGTVFARSCQVYADHWTPDADWHGASVSTCRYTVVCNDITRGVMDYFHIFRPAGDFTRPFIYDGGRGVLIHERLLYSSDHKPKIAYSAERTNQLAPK